MSEKAKKQVVRCQLSTLTPLISLETLVLGLIGGW